MAAICSRWQRFSTAVEGGYRNRTEIQRFFFDRVNPNERKRGRESDRERERERETDDRPRRESGDRRTFLPYGCPPSTCPRYVTSFRAASTAAPARKRGLLTRAEPGNARMSPAYAHAFVFFGRVTRQRRAVRTDRRYRLRSSKVRHVCARDAPSSHAADSITVDSAEKKTRKTNDRPRSPNVESECSDVDIIALSRLGTRCRSRFFTDGRVSRDSRGCANFSNDGH